MVQPSSFLPFLPCLLTCLFACSLKARDLGLTELFLSAVFNPHDNPIGGGCFEVFLSKNINQTYTVQLSRSHKCKNKIGLAHPGQSDHKAVLTTP